MNLDLMQIFRDFRLLTKDVTNTTEASELLMKEFQVDVPEIVDLWQVFHEFIVEKFEIKKLNKKQAEQMDAFIALLYDAFFFGMYVDKLYA
jgi:hypothetical protein